MQSERVDTLAMSGTDLDSPDDWAQPTSLRSTGEYEACASVLYSGTYMTDVSAMPSRWLVRSIVKMELVGSRIRSSILMLYYDFRLGTVYHEWSYNLYCSQKEVDVI